MAIEATTRSFGRPLNSKGSTSKPNPALRASAATYLESMCAVATAQLECLMFTAPLAMES